jgi:hypothetical protein
VRLVLLMVLLVLLLLLVSIISVVIGLVSRVIRGRSILVRLCLDLRDVRSDTGHLRWVGRS